MRCTCSLIVVLGFWACGTLKTAHSDNVKAFARSAKVLATVPGVMYSNLAAYRHELKMVEVATVYRPEKLVEELNTVYSLNQRFLANATQINTSASLIESYAECLLALTDAAYEKQWARQGDQLSLQLSSAFGAYNKAFGKQLPSSVGNFIGGVVTQIGSVKLRRLQKQYLKSFVDTGAIIINSVCDYFTGPVATTLTNELASMDQQFTDVMTHFYDYIYDYQKQQAANPYDYLKQYNPMYMQLKQQLAVLHELEARMVTAMAQIKTAHQSLQTLVDVKLPTELLAEIQELYTATNDVRATLKKAGEK